MEAQIGQGARSSATFEVVQPASVADSFRRRTFWHLEKREGDAGDYIADHKLEAEHVLAGHMGYAEIMGRKGHQFVEAHNKIQLWVPGLPLAERQLWTPERVLDAALHDLFLNDVAPYDVVDREGNLLVTAGITLLLNLLTAGGGTAYSNANAYLGVGDSSTAAAVGQTDLQASSNKLRKAMNATYPTISSPTINFQSSFGSSEANFAWQEVATFNAASVGTMLNRVVQSLGTKSGGSTWTLTETITWS